MSEIKPVYQCRAKGSEDWTDCRQTDAISIEQLKSLSWVEVRTLYPAAAYEAIQKENERLKEENSALEKMYFSQCEAADNFAKQLEGEKERKGDERIKELEEQLAIVNKRLSDSQSWNTGKTKR